MLGFSTSRCVLDEEVNADAPRLNFSLIRSSSSDFYSSQETLHGLGTCGEPVVTYNSILHGKRSSVRLEDVIDFINQELEIIDARDR